MTATYNIEKDRAVYHELADMLYIGYGSGTLDLCDSVEDTPSGITVMYRGGEFAGAEVPFVSERYPSMPGRISVDSVRPFDIVLDAVEKIG